MTKINAFKASLEALYAPEIAMQRKVPIIAEDGTVTAVEPSYDASDVTKEVIEEVLDSHATVKEKIEALESLLSIVSETVDLRGNVITRHAAEALEQYDIRIFPKNYSSKTFTALPSNTNRKVAMEAVDNKIVGIIVAIVAAILALIAKFGGWGESKAEAIIAKVEKVQDGATEKQIETIEEMEEKLEDIKATHQSDGKPIQLSLKDLHKLIIDQLWSDISVKNNGLNLALLMEVLNSSSGNGPYMNFYKQLNGAIRIWKLAADGIFIKTSNTRSGILSNFMVEMDIQPKTDELLNQRISNALDVLYGSANGMMITCLEATQNGLQRCGIKYDFQNMPLVPKDNNLSVDELAKQARSSMINFLTWMRENQSSLIASSNSNITSNDFPKDLFENIKVYDDRVIDAAGSHAFDVSEWQDLVDKKHVKKLDAEIKKMEADITKYTANLLAKKQDGSYANPDAARISGAVKDVMAIHSTMIEVISYYISTITYGVNVFLMWREHFIPNLEHVSKAHLEQLRKEGKIVKDLH